MIFKLTYIFGVCESNEGKKKRNNQQQQPQYSILHISHIQMLQWVCMQKSVNTNQSWEMIANTYARMYTAICLYSFVFQMIYFSIKM